MKIILHTLGRYMQVSFEDAEDPEVRAYSELLDASEAHAFSEQLRDLAGELSAFAEQDRGQILLPFAAEMAA